MSEPAAAQTPEQLAMGAATKAVRQILAKSKDPRTILGRMRPTGVAYQAAWAAVTAHREALAAAGRAPGVRTALFEAPAKPGRYAIEIGNGDRVQITDCAFEASGA